MRILKPFAFISIFSVLTVAHAQAPSHSSVQATRAVKDGATPTEDYSKEAIVIESLRTMTRYESDGTGKRTVYARMRVQSDAGVQQAGMILLGYNSAFERIDIEYVRVTKPDGSKVLASTDSIQDLAAEIQRIAPEYTDFREKHINVPGLRPGDILEYSVVTTIHTPLIPGQFYDEYSFEKKGAVLLEEFEMNVPADRRLSTKFAYGFAPELRTQGLRSQYKWVHSSRPKRDEGELSALSEPQEASPDIQVSTFADWSELAKWYAELQLPRAEPNDDAIRKKAAELTVGMNSEKDKAQAIYNYVATNIRYLGLSFGAGRYQPHSASDVLKNQYGDCKDKHTLLAALLQSVGVKSEPVLISSERKLDPSIPSPLQFNHLISAVLIDGNYVYLDTTTEVAPFAYLIKEMRDKQALRVDGRNGGTLVTTPARSPRESLERIDADARINSDGGLESDFSVKAKGDAEFVWRTILRRTPESQWDQLLKTIMVGAQLEGSVSLVFATNLSDLNKPFELKFHFAKKNYYAPSSNQVKVTLPMAGFLLRPAATPEQKKEPIRLGVQEVVRHLRLEFPNGMIVVPPTPENRVQDFVEYASHYKVEKNVLTADRTYRVTKDEVPRARYKDYNEVFEAATADLEQTAFLISSRGAVNITVEKTRPESKTAAKNDRSATELVSDARDAFQRGQMAETQTLLERAVQKDPKQSDAWGMLGTIYMARSGMDKAFTLKAIESFERQMQLTPTYPSGWKVLGLAYLKAGRYSDAADSFAKQLETAPDERGINGMLSDALMKAGRTKEAIKALEREVAEDSTDSHARVELAKAYYLSGESGKGGQVTDSLIVADASPNQRALVAEMLAETKQSPDLAEQQVQMALSAAYEALGEKPDVKSAGESDLSRAAKLALIWQNAGWIYFHHGNLARAQRYLEAAWMWSLQFEAGNRLAEVYLQQGKRNEAIRVWAEAFAAASAEHPDARRHFVEAVGDSKKADLLVVQHKLDLQEMRTITVPNPGKIAGSGQFYISVGPGSRVDAAAQCDGDERVAVFSEQLLKLRMELPLPDEQALHVLRTGILSCYGSTPTCMFVLIPQPSITMLPPDVF